MKAVKLPHVFNLDNLNIQQCNICKCFYRFTEDSVITTCEHMKNEFTKIRDELMDKLTEQLPKEKKR